MEHLRRGGYGTFTYNTRLMDLSVSGSVVWILHLLPIRRRFIPHYSTTSSRLHTLWQWERERAEARSVACLWTCSTCPRGRTMKVMEVYSIPPERVVAKIHWCTISGPLLRLLNPTIRSLLIQLRCLDFIVDILYLIPTSL